ncbi:MAG: glycosyltransferase [Pseudomonadota bacterium]|nr:glycosyltransferase [Pseudomonadota bacterium]
MAERVLHLIFYGDPNGYPPIINCVRSLAQDGWRISLVCRDARTHPDVVFPDSVTVIRAPSDASHRWREYLSFTWKALRLTPSDASVVAGHDMHGLVPAALASVLRSLPLVYHCHDYSELKRKLPAGSAVVKRLERLFARKAALTIVPDSRRAEVVARELRLRRPPFVLPNSPPRSSIPKEAALRRTLATVGIRFEKILLRQGRIGPNHGIEATIRSMPQWADRRWGFVLIGPSKPAFIGELDALSKELGVHDRFVVMPPISYDEILSYTLDGNLGHALYEPSNINHVEMGTASNKVLEYMASGVPCLVSTSSSAASLVASFECGVAADPSNPEDIARAINSVFLEHEVSKRMATAGQRAFQDHLCYEVRFRELAQQMDNVASLR